MVRQAIPRPEWARRIDYLSHGAGQSELVFPQTVGALREALAFGSFVDDARSVAVAPQGNAGAAVLIVLVPARGQLDTSAFEADPADPEIGISEMLASSILLTRRAGHLRANPGEIAFPGGRIELGESALAAALRESEEEVALVPGAVEVLGELPTVLAALRDVPIRPFVAVAERRPLLQANPDEVDSVLLVPLSELTAPGRYWQENWGPEDDPDRIMHFFDLGEDVIWGATARILHELFVRLFSGWSRTKREQD